MLTHSVSSGSFTVMAATDVVVADGLRKNWGDDAARSTAPPSASAAA